MEQKNIFFPELKILLLTQLVSWFKENIQDPLASQKIDVATLLGDMNSLEDAWGPEILTLLFSSKKEETLKYLSTRFDSFFEDICQLKDQSVKQNYLLSLLSGIQEDKSLVLSYLDAFEKNISLFQNDLATKQLISTRLFELSQSALFDSQDERDQQSIARIFTLKATIDAQKLSDQPKSLEWQIQTLITSGVWMLFTHPIGKMLMSFLDSLFGGKGGLKKMFGRIPGFNEELDREFQKQYGLQSEQLWILASLTEENFPNPDLSTVKSEQQMDLLRENMLENNYYNTLLTSFFDEWWEGTLKNVENSDSSPYVLDAWFLSTFYLNYNKEIKMGTSLWISLYCWCDYQEGFL
jgi:hypothetical protein